ncbi:MAG: type VI secretion system tube protein Hcp [Chloroflexi bacterium]|jgi:type VI secretion system secreted protein Hcp|nr:type VI secretion system tube protein Hcp [Chloroflexota bacterium]
MASDYFLEIDGIEGESTDEAHRGAIEVQSWSWGASTPSSVGSGGLRAGKVSIQDFHFTHRVDAASPTLFLRCASGQHIKSAKLFVRKAGGGDEYLTYTFTDCLVSSFEDQGGGDAPTEEIAMAFRKIEMEYTVLDATGAAGKVVKGGWDLATNKKV